MDLTEMWKQTIETTRIRRKRIASLETFDQTKLPYIMVCAHPKQLEETTVRKGHVNLAIYNLLGQKVKTLIDWEMAPGQQDVLWDGTDNNSENVSSGIYFYRLSAGDFHDIKKMMLLK